ncbi:MAG: Holliday junction resolvase [Thermoplasmata archaeon]|nr:Holliday junction resolvase [Thermoplasmata archaeon]
MAGNIYERELRSILSGNKEFIVKFTKTFDELEKSHYISMIEKPFVVVRAAGSLGVDLIVLRYDFSFPIEVKSSKFKILRFAESNGRAQDQAENYIKITSRAGIFPIYAYRLKRTKGDPWRLFTLPEMIVHGNLLLIYNLLPKMEKSKDGNFILRWEEGLPLSRFISYLNRK